MRLAEFILSRREPIMQQWESFAATILPDAKLDQSALRNHVSYLLEFIARDIETHQTRQQQRSKSQGRGEKEDGDSDSAAEVHGALRFVDGFDILQTASEFRALRASVMSLWDKAEDKTEDDCRSVNRFHESIDQMLMEALSRHYAEENRARSLFLGTLVHDMRTPLGAISNSVEILRMIDAADAMQEKVVNQIDRSNKTVVKLVADLIDATRAKLGKGMPVTPAPMNMGEAARQAAREAEISAQRGSVQVETVGDLEGEWDSLRINQVFSNLIGNALQHGGGDVVKVAVRAGDDGVILSVHNDGKPIPPDETGLVFDPLRRGAGDAQKQTEASSLGLGLFITKEIIDAHGGKIEVTSTEEEGTTFSAWLPRRPVSGHSR